MPSTSPTVLVNFQDAPQSQHPPDSPDHDHLKIDTEESVEALVYAGLKRASAEHVLNLYLSRFDPENNSYDLSRHIEGHIRHKTVEANSSDRAILDQLGVNEALQERIMDPEFTDIFETQSIRFWAKEAVIGRFRGLVKVLERDEDIDEPCIEHGENSRLPQRWVSTGTKPSVPAEHIRLYKSISASRIRFNWLERRDGSIFMPSIFLGNGDFNDRQMAWYFSDKRDIPERYRRYMAQLIGNSETWMMSFDVPLSFFDSVKKEELYYGDEWKRYIWFCRTMRTVPKDLKHFENADILEGHVCKSPSDAIRRIAEENVLSEMTEDRLMYVGNSLSPARQIVISNDGPEELAQAVKGKVFIEIFPALDTNQVKKEDSIRVITTITIMTK